MTVRILATLALLATLLVSTACLRTTVDPEAQAALDAASRHVRIAGQSGSIGTFKLQVDRMDGVYARIHVWPNADESVPPLLLFMKKVDNRWEPLTMGNTFQPGELEGWGVPASLDPARRS